MSLLLAAAIAFMVFVTALLSGIFGMAGGMILMGFLVWVLPVGAAMMLHGAAQATANGYRAFLNRSDIRWDIFRTNMLGALAALAVLSSIAFVPDKVTVFLLLGIVPFAAAALPTNWALDIERPFASPFCGFVVTLLNLTAGVAGALLDVFFTRTTLTRHQIVATKAVTQTFSHTLKLFYFGVLLHEAAESSLTWTVYVVIIPLSILGTTAGKRLLDAMNDIQFKRWSQWITLVIGTVLLARGIAILL
jgi:uncharacterized membrane protein YfcA